VEPIHVDSLRTPLGRIWAAAGERALLRVLLPGSGGRDRLLRDLAGSHGRVRIAGRNALTAGFFEELNAYFQRKLFVFSTPVAPQGTDFQQRVWQALRGIPYGETRSYGSVAGQVGLPRGGARAVGQANARNPVPIIVPCHRVVASDGGLGGFSSGLDHKRRLLRLERGGRGG